MEGRKKEEKARNPEIPGLKDVHVIQEAVYS